MEKDESDRKEDKSNNRSEGNGHSRKIQRKLLDIDEIRYFHCL